MFRVYAKAQQIIYGGQRGENIARCVCFPLTDMQAEFGVGTWNVVMQSPGETVPYIVQYMEEVGNYAVWGLDDTDTAIAGEGKCELRYYVNEVLCKTKIFPIVIKPSLGLTGDIPDPYEDILDTIAEYKSQAQSAAVRAEEAAEEAASVITGDVTNAVRWDVSQLLSDTEKATARSNIGAAGGIKESASGAMASFENGAEGYAMDSVVANIEPVQDLHGYDHPWPAGGGKNLLNVTANTTTINGITYTVNKDTQGNVVSINANGTSTGAAYIGLEILSLKEGTYKFYIFSSGLASKWYADCPDSSHRVNSEGGTFTVSSDGDVAIWFNIRANQTINNVLFYPMVAKSDVTVNAYEPYSNICPISGWDAVSVTRTGKNLLNPTLASGTYAGLTAVRQSDKSYSLTGTATGSAVNIWVAGNFIANPSTQLDVYKLYYLEADTTITFKDCKLFFYDVETGQANVTFRNDYVPIGSDAITLTVPHNAWLTGIRIPDAIIGDTYNTTLYPQIELGSTATAYEPYQGETVTTTLPQTVYGGTLDVVSGVLTIDRAKVTFTGASSEAWVVSGHPDSPVEGHSFVMDNLAPLAKAWGELEVSDSISNYCVASSGAAIWRGSGVYIFNLNERYCGVRPLGIDTVADFRSFLASNPLEICYQIATPQIIQLTKQQVTTLLGLNNIWADSGEVSVVYTADTKLYIDKKFETLTNAIISMGGTV